MSKKSDDGITLRGRAVRFTRGLPELDAEALKFGEQHSKNGLIYPVAFIPLVGYGIAHAVYSWGATPLYEKQIAAIKAADCGWMYLIDALFSLLTVWLNAVPVYFKNKLFHAPGDIPALDNFELSNLRGPTQQVYKQLSASANGVPSVEEKSRGYVVVENDGLVGQYNRSNRSMHHFCENNVATGARLICSAFAFPFPTFVTFLLFATGRIMHQVGYASGPGGGGGGVGGYSSLVRVTGMILFNMLLGELPQIGFVLYAGLAAL